MNSMRPRVTVLTVLLIVLLSTVAWGQGLLDANDFYKQGKYQEARQICEQLIQKDPEYTGAIFLLGKIHFALGNLDQAKQYVDKAIQMDLTNPDYRDTHSEMASFASKLTEASRLYNNADYEGAEKIYLELIELNKNFVDAYVNLARVYVRLNNLTEAAKYYRKAIEMRPENEDYQKEFAALIKRYLVEGNQLMQRKSYSAALEKFDQAIRLNPKDHMAYYFKAVVYMEEKNLEEALQAVNESIELDDTYPKAHLVKGKIYMMQRNIEAALAAFNKATKLDSEYLDAWNNIGYLYYHIKEYDKAIPAYKKVIDLRPEYPTSYMNLGTIYIEKEKYSEAIKMLTKAATINPSDHTTWYRLSQAYNAEGKCEQAKSAAQTALTYKNQWAPVLFELGIAERCLGNTSAARQAFQLAARDPRWKKAAEYELKTLK